MEKKVELMFKQDVKRIEEKVGRKLNSKEKKELKKEYDNPIFTSVSLRKGEGDIRLLNEGDYHQLQNRNERDNLAYLKFLTGNTSDLYCACLAILKQLGCDDPIKAVSDISIEIEEKMKQNK